MPLPLQASKLLFLLLAAIAVTLVIADPWGWKLAKLVEQKSLLAFVTTSGTWGPIIIMLLMAIAVVFSPLPSAPIAIVAGATYGHYAGTVIVVAGATIGAVIAFSVARWLAQDTVKRWLNERSINWLSGSQNIMMITILVARMIPFLSFDVISYAAGLTNLSLARFIIATLIGLIPVSFLLTHAGALWVVSQGGGVLSWVLIGGLITLIPAVTILWTKITTPEPAIPKDKR